MFRWTGSHNLYYNIQSYWKINSENYEDRPPRSFDQWVELWTDITATAEDDAAELTDEILKFPTNIRDRTAGEILEIPPETLQLKIARFLDEQPPFTTDSDGKIPGISPSLAGR